jgi:hypothetical protein
LARTQNFTVDGERPRRPEPERERELGWAVMVDQIRPSSSSCPPLVHFSLSSPSHLHRHCRSFQSFNHYNLHFTFTSCTSVYHSIHCLVLSCCELIALPRSPLPPSLLRLILGLSVSSSSCVANLHSFNLSSQSSRSWSAHPNQCCSSSCHCSRGVVADLLVLLCVPCCVVWWWCGGV